ncbi:hypothetical protein GCM10009821_28700 [Aeromicrobium halocynthiae]|uniref:DUF368 domain-containing protein n=1 Tax=Aeromicrobium halocynthiae TaxID=560557 RepID=A0ABN2W837_9ACTN
MRTRQSLIDVVRGALIGIVEIVPGVSGGTVALIVGLYETLIESAGHVVRGVVKLLADLPRGRGAAGGLQELRSARWSVLVPVGIGMVTAVVLGARAIAPLLEEHPVPTRAFFAGLIIVSLVVPIRMVGGRWSVVEVGTAGVAAVVAFLLTSLPPSRVDDPSLWIVVGAAAVAICALVLPGLSGSFLLLAMGLYAPTLDAVNDRDLAYLGAFMVGAILGLGSFVEVLRYLLRTHWRLTLAAMTGVMVGALRALWPWQDDDGALLGASGSLAPVVVAFLVGAALVGALLLLERVLTTSEVEPAG